MEGTKYKETCQYNGWFRSWWFWRWGGYTLKEDWCELNWSKLDIESDSIDIGDFKTLTGTTPNGNTAAAPSCSSLGGAWTQDGATTTQCFTYSGFGSNRDCDPSKGDYEVKRCVKSAGRVFALTKYSIQDDQCWPEAGYGNSNNKFPTCGVSKSLYQMNEDGSCQDAFGRGNTVSANPRFSSTQSASVASANAPTSASIGGGAAVVIAPAAIIGAFLVRKAKRKKVPEKAPLNDNGDSAL
jgi:hypothetical protein